MPMTNEQLEAAYNALSDRIKILERKMMNVVSTAHQNATLLVVQESLDSLNTTLTTISNRLDAIEGKVNDLV
jgi:tetrahydromethanopterin S-methyltransferase subunit G